MKYLVLFKIAFALLSINVSAQSIEKLSNDDSIIMVEIRNKNEFRRKALEIPAFDTNYFYTSNGVIDTVKILSDTAFHWGGVFFSTDDFNNDFMPSFYYGQYIIDKESGRKKPIGKCLWFISSYHFSIDGIRYRNKRWNQVMAIIYYDNEGNLIKCIDLGFEDRKIIEIRNKF